jgi:excisionase family DNA binding protein
MGARNPAWETIQTSPAIVAGTPTEPFIDAEQASRLLRLSAKTIMRLAREGVVPAHPLAGTARKRWRFLESELYAWARERLNLDRATRA